MTMGAIVPPLAQFFGHWLTTDAGLACPSRIHNHHQQASFFRFAREDSQELVPASIRNTFRKAMVAHHVLDTQSFDSKRTVGVHNLARFSVVKVPALVADVAMGLGHQQFGTLPVLAP